MRCLKRVKVVVCCLTNVDISKEFVKAVGINFSYSAVIQNKLNLSATIFIKIKLECNHFYNANSFEIM